jgi:SAM-dependent methyltransferase
MPPADPRPPAATPDAPRPSDRQRFLDALHASVEQRGFVKLVLSRHRGAGSDLNRVAVRPVQLKGEACLSLVHSHATRDLTSNLPWHEGLAALDALVGTDFAQAHLFTTTGELQLLTSKKGRHTFVRGKASEAAPPAPAEGHDREKRRWVELDRPFLHALGVTDAQHRLVPAMSRKWKQINKFVEVLDRALATSSLLQSPDRPIRVADFGSGKGYLTFAVHDHLRHTLGREAEVTGVELRPDMVALCGEVAQRLALPGLRFDEGDVRSYAAPAIDVMIALHACDTATDHAIDFGLRAGASVIVCSPCCHKEVRPQLLSPHPLRPVLRHGVHLGQEAEMLTDALRALLLEACGYDTQVFEFVALEHTAKNKMILAVKRPGTAASAARREEEAWGEVRELKSFYGIREQCLETLLASRRERLPDA